MRGWMSVGIAVSLVWVAGCSGSKVPVPVSGTVKTASGQPVKGVNLVLKQVDDPEQRSFGFALDDQGKFKGKCVAGKYLVCLGVVECQLDEDTPEAVLEKERPKYAASLFQLKTYPPDYSVADIDVNKVSPDRLVEVKSNGTLEVIINN